MAFQFKTIGLFGTHHNPQVTQSVAEIYVLLMAEGFRVMIEIETAKAANLDVITGALAELGQQCDLVITIGGDGNLLHSGRILSQTQTPVIGINRGKFGYLTDIAPDEIDEKFLPILKGEYDQEKRFLISANVLRDGKIIEGSNALNDIVLFPGAQAKLIQFELRIDDVFVYSQRSDGLIVSTPTGSTAYALSAGGPILQPDLDVLLLVPKFPHTLTSRPLVISGQSEIELVIADYNEQAPLLSFDGGNEIELQQGDIVQISKQSNPLTLIHPKGHDYYQNLRNKLGWSKPFIAI